MSFDTSFITSAVPVTVLTTHGDIDASNYQELIRTVQDLYEDGTRNLLLDLGDTAFISSSGLVAMHSIALILNGGQPLNTEDGWAALRSMGQGLGFVQEHLKLLNPLPRVDRTLEISGLKPFFRIFTDREEALASFQLQDRTAGSSPA
jgi:anti-anti-sigma regulatory factor